MVIYHYKFGSICFELIDSNKYTVSDILIDKPNFAGPRNIKVGDEVEIVLQKFPYNRKSSIDKNEEKYVYGKVGVNCGFIVFDKKK